jgi:hypothetical protein
MGKRSSEVQVAIIGGISVTKAVIKFKIQLSDGKSALGLNGVIHDDFLARDIKIKALWYSNLLRNDMLQAIWKKRPGNLS